MARPVQLTPGSLALVLCRLEAQEAAGGAEEPGGRAVFRAFCRANTRCFWNSRLARAASRLAFQGWLRRGVLLVHAPPASLQVLRDAWCRRALRPPRGFRIRAVGECGAQRGGRSALAAGPSPSHRVACARGSTLRIGRWRWRPRGWEDRLSGWRRAVLLRHSLFWHTGAAASKICLGAALSRLQCDSIPQLFQPVECTGSWSKELSTCKSDALGREVLGPGSQSCGQETGASVSAPWGCLGRVHQGLARFYRL